MKENNILPIVNIAAYRFVSLAESSLAELREVLRDKARALSIKGSILLSTEGINLFLAGEQLIIDRFIDDLNQYPEFKDLDYKVSYSKDQPFSRMLVKLKHEIIAFGQEGIVPEKKTSPYLAPETLKQWYEEGREMIILDTRNDYELRLGHFDQAINLNIDSFRDFPEAIAQLDPALKDKPIITYCTGGVRCEKAGPYLEAEGFNEVYQLKGGILAYFEACGNAHYQGECFVFDKRVALDATLQETKTIQCYACRSPLTLAEQQEAPGHCSYCDQSLG